jgi:hypothetical protein
VHGADTIIRGGNRGLVRHGAHVVFVAIREIGGEGIEFGFRENSLRDENFGEFREENVCA